MLMMLPGIWFFSSELLEHLPDGVLYGAIVGEGGNLITKFVNGLNSIVARELPYWLFVLLVKAG